MWFSHIIIEAITLTLTLTHPHKHRNTQLEDKSTSPDLFHEKVCNCEAFVICDFVTLIISSVNWNTMLIGHFISIIIIILSVLERKPHRFMPNIKQPFTANITRVICHHFDVNDWCSRNVLCSCEYEAYYISINTACLG